jgi:pyruvate dehydrogenase E2 component (dihydrolipoamide acetyltransferase)
VPIEIKVPRLGWSMEEGTFVEWLKRDGEFVEAGQPLFAIEGDKAIQDVEAIGSGILRISPRAPESGEPVQVGVTLAFLIGAGEADPFSAAEPQKPAPQKPAPDKPTTPQPAKPKPEVPLPKPPQPAKPRPEAPRPGTAPSKTPPPAAPEPEIAPPKSPGPKPSAPEIAPPRPTEPEIAPSAPPQHEPGSPNFGSRPIDGNGDWQGRAPFRRRISPRAARVAGELGIDWQRLTGTGRGGRIRERDVRTAAESNVAQAASARPTAVAPIVAERGESASRVALRRTIAARMVAASQTTAPVTLTTTADATNLVSLRAQFKSAATTGEAAGPGYIAFIARLASQALVEHPPLNQQWIDGRIETPNGIHVAIAVDTPAGLLTPVLRDTTSLGIREIAARLADLSARARSGELTAAELTGGTFTISNLGPQGIDAFTPILNLPQCAILGLGRIERRPAVVGDQIVPRDQMVLSLTFDHRIVDGAPAAQFLATLRERIENPGAWLVN